MAIALVIPEKTSRFLGKIDMTTVHQPSREMGVEMARVLLALLRGGPTDRERVMPTRMVIRDSA